jgi:hypothetical protein
VRGPTPGNPKTNKGSFKKRDPDDERP